MSIQTRSEIEEMGAQVAYPDFKTWFAVTTRLHTLQEGTQTAVYMAARPHAALWLQKALASGERKRIVSALYRMAEVAQKLGDYPAVRAVLDKLIALEKQHPDRSPGTFSIAGYMLKEQGDLATARQYMEEAVAIARDITKIDGCTADMLFGLGLVAGAQGDLEVARQSFSDSLTFRQAWNKRYPQSDRDRHTFLLYYEFAAILLPHKHIISAIQLLAAAHTIGQRLEEPADFHEHPRFCTTVTQARNMTDDATFDRAWNEGLTMTLEQIRIQLFS